MVAVTVVVKVRPEKREEFLQAMRSLSNGGEKPQGLRGLALHQEIDDQIGFILIYEWETQEDLDRFLATEKFRVLLGALKVLCEKSEIRYSHVSEKLPEVANGAYEQ